MILTSPGRLLFTDGLNPKMSLGKIFKNLLTDDFGILSFLPASCPQDPLDVARYVFECLEPNLLAIRR